jgi:hypothetical protein
MMHCINFESETDISYNTEAISKNAKVSIESIFNFNDKISFAQELPDKFTSGPRTCIETMLGDNNPNQSLPMVWF